MSQMFEPFLQGGPATALRAQPLDFQEAPADPAGGARLVRDANPLQRVKVHVQVRVGGSAMTLGELMAARENEVLVLDRGIDDPVDLLLEGQVVARGQLVAVQGVLGVRITELPLPLQF